MTEYDLHTQGARHSFDRLVLDNIEDHDAISVQMCRDAGLDDATTSVLLRRLTLRADVENARMRAALRAIANTKTRPGDEKAGLLLASAINLATVALAQGGA